CGRRCAPPAGANAPGRPVWAGAGGALAWSTRTGGPASVADMTTAHPPGGRPVALVTGAARRIGAAIARTLHAAGYDLVLHHHTSQADALALRDELLAARGDSVVLVRADLADDAASAVLVQAALDGFGRLDALVNNASRFRPTPLGTITPSDPEIGRP